ncbi:MAG: ribonuclease P protein component [Oscillospiraceae bacterium]|nr:ribonuclease P protein component [Oscillospiraceae bacterium]
MKNTVSLKLNRDFRNLYRRGKSSVSPYLALYARKTKNAGNRVGITVSTKVGHAVVRNRVRRRIREAYRLNEELFLSGLDVVIVARVRARDASFAEIEKSLCSLARGLGILREVQE